MVFKKYLRWPALPDDGWVSVGLTCAELRAWDVIVPQSCSTVTSGFNAFHVISHGLLISKASSSDCTMALLVVM
jgi:hypothetical protein